MSDTAPREQRRRVAAARAVRRERSDRRSGWDLAYLVYVALLVAAIVGVPLVRAAVLALALPASQLVLTSIASRPVIALLAGATAGAALAWGRVRGPIAPAPFLAATWATSSITPRIAWGRELGRGFAAVLFGLAAVAALAVSGFLGAGEAPLPSVGFIVGTALSAIPIAASWLAAQVLGKGQTIALGLVVALTTVAGAFGALPPWSTPWSLLASLWPAADAPDVAAATALVILGAVAIAASAAVPPLVARLDPSTVLAHAQRWDALTGLVRTGDLSAAADRIRARPSAGRRIRIPFTPPVTLAIAQRDAVGLARTPGRLASAIGALVASGALWGGMHAADAGLRWALALPAGLLAFAALGVFSDGFRSAADTPGRPVLFRQSAAGLMMRHAVLPALALIVPAVGAGLTAGGAAAATAAALGAALVALRAYDSAKGPLPIELLMPIPTPAGDASQIAVALWQADALVIVGVLSVSVGAGSAADIAMLMWVAPAIAVLAALTVGRVRRSAG